MSTDALENAARSEFDDSNTPTMDDIVSAAQSLEQAFRKKVHEHEPGEWPEQCYLWIVPYFKTFCYPDPKEPKAMADHLTAVRESLNSGQVSAIQGVTPQIEDWEGQARDSFFANFLVPFPDAVDNQIEVVDELRVSLWAYEGILRAGRADAKTLLDTTADALDAFDGGKAAKRTYALIIVAALAGVLKDVPGAAAAGGGQKLGLSVIASGSNAERGTERAKGEIGGKTVSEIMNTFVAATEKLRPLMEDEEGKLATELGNSNELVDKILSSSDPTTLMKLLPNEIGDDGADLTDGKPNDTAEFRPPYL